MSRALKTEEEKKEFFDSPDLFDQKISQLAQLIKTSNHFIAFTGAGISTSAGIADFRSGINTTLPTGPGKWERIATGTQTKPQIRTTISSAIPTPTHMALIKLQEAGYLKFLISQNTDGLHRRSGFPLENLAELHGNSNLEICKKRSCGKEFLRDFNVLVINKDINLHETGRKCEYCGGKLYNTVVNFGEKLPIKEKLAGFEHAEKADLCLSLGSSLRVAPASDMPLEVVRHGGQHVIVNLQATPLDNSAMRINGLIDDVMIKLMEKLELEIPKFILRRRVVIEKVIKDGKQGVVVRGVDEFGTPYELLKKAMVLCKESGEIIETGEGQKEPYRIFLSQAGGGIQVDLEFYRHYQEPNYSLEIDLGELELGKAEYYLLEYEPEVKQWVKCEKVEVKNRECLKRNVHVVHHRAKSQ